MQKKLKWKKTFFSNLYTIYDNGKQIGELTDSLFSQTSNGKLNGKKYAFQIKSFFKQNVEIIDSVENKVVGKISYDNFMSKAKISFDNKTINSKYDDLWGAKWNLFNSEGVTVKYSSSSTGGEIDSNIDDDLLLLSGLFVSSHYWKYIIILLVIVFFSLAVIFL
ncbi:MAG: hypothetical protein IMY72_06890 [Bacteroidetes bacterium]|nr:hypothetical protein [Bacteroidota bacterium]